MTFEPKHGRRYNEINPEKKAMYKKLYLSGLTIAEIGSALGGIGPRTTYHHLRPLTPEEIGEHNKNQYIRRQAQRAKLKGVKHG